MEWIMVEQSKKDGYERMLVPFGPLKKRNKRKELIVKTVIYVLKAQGSVPEESIFFLR